MSTEDRLNMAFRQFLSSSVSDELLCSIKDSIGPEDVDMLMQAVLSLRDPSEYCKHDLDSETVSGFFLFLDFMDAAHAFSRSKTQCIFGLESKPVYALPMQDRHRRSGRIWTLRRVSLVPDRRPCHHPGRMARTVGME
jgi:hypothetical protein